MAGKLDSDNVWQKWMDQDFSTKSLENEHRMTRIIGEPYIWLLTLKTLLMGF